MAQNQTIELYRAAAFPPEWLRDKLCLRQLDSSAHFEVIDGMRRRPTKGG